MILRSQFLRASFRVQPRFTNTGSLFQLLQPHILPVSTTCTLAPSDSKTSLARTTQVARHFSSSPNTSSPQNTANMASQYKTRKVAAPNTLEHRIYIEKDGVPVSPFHDIPLYANEAQTILNMVVEIPRWTNGKLEISKV
jgi:inorganic pyrophosphatase